MNPRCCSTLLRLLCLFVVLSSCQQKTGDLENADTVQVSSAADMPVPIAPPLVTHIYTADPSAHVFDGRIYIYPSHDIPSDVPEDDEGGHFDMKDYHVLSMDSIGGEVTDHGVALAIDDVPWATRQMWAPDAAFKNGKYYLYFPAKDENGVFRIGVAISTAPAGPFQAEANFIPGSYSIDPAVFVDTDGKAYMYFGGIWGGQLQRWRNGQFDAAGSKTDLQNDSLPAIGPRVARLKENMLAFDEPVREIEIVDANGQPLLGGDHDRRFFEAPWMHKYNGKYYLSYSTGDTHLIVYATADNPYGPFTYQGVVLKPVIGWTNHHSIVQVNGQWYLFYHDSVLSGGKTHLRSVRVTPVEHDEKGMIRTVTPYLQ